MGCGCKDKKKLTKPHVEEVAKKFTEVTGTDTIIGIKTDEYGVEYYDFTVVVNDKGEEVEMFFDEKMIGKKIKK